MLKECIRRVIFWFMVMFDSYEISAECGTLKEKVLIWLYGDEVEDEDAGWQYPDDDQEFN